MEKQEAAFSAWLNSVLVPAKASEEGLASQALAARCLAAKVRGLLWHLYSADTDVIASMLKVEKHIDAGQLRLKDEVCPCTLQCLALQHRSKTTPLSHCEGCNADIHKAACTPSMPPCWLHASVDVAGPPAHVEIVVLLHVKTCKLNGACEPHRYCEAYESKLNEC